MSDPQIDTLAALTRAVTPEATIQAFMHDPPDKALTIPGHQGRAARYLSEILSEIVRVEAIKSDSALADQLASIAERLPMPTAGAGGLRAVGPQNGRLRVYHPLGGTVRDIPVPEIDEVTVVNDLTALCSGIDDRRALARLLWRCLPERMAAIDPAYAWLPADTRVPDHTIWNHADTVTAFAAGVGATGKGDYALLSFAISPVQSFIAAARTLRDLRNGSLLLSWLAFQAMRPVLERVGPTAFIFPSLRGNAMVDQWLRSEAGGLGSKITLPTDTRLLSPSLPNTFLALVPMGPDGTWAQALAREVEKGAKAGWVEIAGAVRRRLGENLGDFPGWDIRWETQIAQTWDVVTCVLALRDCSDEKLAEYRGKATFADAYAEAEKVRALGRSIPGSDRPGYAQDAVGRWQAQVELAGRLLAAARSVRHVPLQQQFTGEVPEKCTLLGSWERMGPGNRIKSGKFWAHVAGQVRMDGARVRPGEALCATALVKRFAVGAFLGRELGLTEHRDTFPDTATLAARLWLEQPEAAQVKAFSQQGNWNGQWLHWPSRDADEDDCCPDTVWQAIRDAKQRHDPPPTYYAVLMLDGDGMGDWLAGRNSPRLREALHPKLADYFGRLPGAQPGLDVPRPVSPSLHAAISEALGNFSQHVVPTIVETHGGALVYAGGDDVLALLPTERALACARALDRAFRGDEAGNNGAPPGYYRLGNGPDLLTMGRHASISAGIAVVHYKEDLRAALQWARDAERAAKNFGRNALSLTIARRSGEHASAALDWGLMDTLSEAVPRFRAASDRWAYRMRALLPVFQPEGPPEAAFLAELGRQIARGDDQATRELPVLAFYEQMRAAPGPPGTRTAEHWTVTAERLITLWQSASFLARGRDVAGRT